MVADNDSGSASSTGAGQTDSQRGQGAGVWVALAAVVVLAVVALILLTQCAPRVPDLVGLTRKEAESRLQAAGYEVGEVSLVEDSKTPAGHVSEQAPAAGTLLAKGNPVDLLIVRGSELVKVPDLIGHDTASAESILKAVGLVMKTSSEYSATIPAGAVVSQSPVAGTEVRVASEVLVSMSLGPTPESQGTSGTVSDTPAAESWTDADSGSGAAPTPASACTDAYPGASVWTSGGNIYARLTSGGSTRQLTSGSAWDTAPMLSPSAKYVVFLRGNTSGSTPNRVGRVCLTDFKVSMISLPMSSETNPSFVYYPDYAFAPRPNGTAPGSDWLVIAQTWGPAPPLGSTEPSRLKGRLLVCNVPMSSSWASWNIAFNSTSGISLSRSSRAGCVHVESRNSSGKITYSRDFNAYTGIYE